MHTLFIGIVVALLVTEFTGFSPGGIVVAGYLALFAAHPTWLGATLAASLVTYGLVKLAEQRMLLYGRRLFAVYLLAGMLISQAVSLWSRGGAGFDMGIVVIGYLVPGLIARDFGRQGVLPTLLAVSLAVTLTALASLMGEGLLW